MLPGGDVRDIDVAGMVLKAFGCPVS
jgi:hypothetical protein